MTDTLAVPMAIPDWYSDVSAEPDGTPRESSFCWLPRRSSSNDGQSVRTYAPYLSSTFPYGYRYRLPVFRLAPRPRGFAIASDWRGFGR